MGLFGLLLWSFKISLYNLDTILLSDLWFANILSKFFFLSLFKVIFGEI